VLVVSGTDAPTFSARGPGTPARVWRAHPGWTASTPLTLEGVERLVVLAAHPDDESLGAGGLIASACAAGVQVALVCATNGEGSHPGSPTLSPGELGARREVEASQAAEALGVPMTGLHHLRLPDGGLDGLVEEVTRALVDLVGDGRDCVLVSPWRNDGHPDHEAAGRAAAAAARRTGEDLWEYSVWFWHWSRPDQAPWNLVRPFELERASESAKSKAIAAHRTQVEPLSGLEGDETLLSSELLEHFLSGPEHFVTTPSGECPDDALDDLHREHSDPWGVETRWYEERKRNLVLAVLPRRRFDRVLELGCSTGLLAQSLADRASQVLAVDRSPAALEAARERLANRPEVSVADLDVPTDWPDGALFDLVVVSEVGYFLSPAAIEELAARVATSLAPDGVVVLCHRRHSVDGWVMDADEVHERFARAAVPPLQASYRDRDVEIRVHAHDSGWPDPGA